MTRIKRSKSLARGNRAQALPREPKLEIRVDYVEQFSVADFHAAAVL